MRLPNVYLSLFDRGGSIDTGNGGDQPDMSCTCFTPTELVTADYSAVIDTLVRCDPSGGSFTVTLPGASAGDVVTVVNQSDSEEPIAVVGTGGNTIAGSSTFIVSGARVAFILVFDGADDWMVI